MYVCFVWSWICCKWRESDQEQLPHVIAHLFGRISVYFGGLRKAQDLVAVSCRSNSDRIVSYFRFVSFTAEPSMLDSSCWQILGLCEIRPMHLEQHEAVWRFKFLLRISITILCSLIRTRSFDWFHGCIPKNREAELRTRKKMRVLRSNIWNQIAIVKKKYLLIKTIRVPLSAPTLYLTYCFRFCMEPLFQVYFVSFAFRFWVSICFGPDCQ